MANNISPTSATDFATKGYVDGLVGAVGAAAAQAVITPSGNDQSVELQAAVDGVDEGASILIKASSSNLILTSTLTISRALTLRGESMSPIYGPSDQLPADDAQVMPTTTPFLKGAVLNMRTAATNAIRITTVGSAVNLRDIGIVFGRSGDSIIFQNTGHGIIVDPPVQGSNQNQGIMGAYWQNVMVYGHDGNHYAFKMTNPELSTFNHLHSFGGGGFYIESNGAPPENGVYGNIVFEHPYAVLCAPGTAHGVAYANNAQVTNMLMWLRPQVWAWTVQGTVAGFTSALLTPDYANQYMWLDKGPAGRDYVIAADMESQGAGKISSNSAWDGMAYWTSDRITFSNPAGLYAPFGSFWVPTTQFGGGGYARMMYLYSGLGASGSAPIPTAAAGANAGTSPPAPVVDTQSSMLSGRITWGSGTTPAAGDQVVVTYGGGGDPLRTPRVILNPNNDVTSQLGLRVTAQSGTAFKITTHSAPAGSQANTVYSADWIAVS